MKTYKANGNEYTLICSVNDDLVSKINILESCLLGLCLQDKTRDFFYKTTKEIKKLLKVSKIMGMNMEDAIHKRNIIVEDLKEDVVELKSEVPYLKVWAIKCHKCGDTIYSRTRHDMRWCTCESIAIDGGFDYIKVSGEPDSYSQVQIVLPKGVTKSELHKDWDKSTDKYGLIKGDKSGKRKKIRVKESS